jgi:outer membrane protein
MYSSFIFLVKIQHVLGQTILHTPRPDRRLFRTSSCHQVGFSDSSLARHDGVSRDARSNYLPQVTLHGGFEADRQRFAYRGGGDWLVSIGLRWNLFNGGADKAKIAESEANTRRAAAEQARAESGIRLQVRQAWAILKAAHQRIESAQTSVAEAQESLRISQNRFAAGLNTVTDLLRTETALLETQTRYLAAVHDQRIAAAMLEFAAGTLNPNSEVLN